MGRRGFAITLLVLATMLYVHQAYLYMLFQTRIESSGLVEVHEYLWRLGCSVQLADSIVAAYRRGESTAASLRRFEATYGLMRTLVKQEVLSFGQRIGSTQLDPPKDIRTISQPTRLAILNTGMSRGFLPGSPSVHSVQKIVHAFKRQGVYVSMFAVMDIQNRQKPVCEGDESLKWRDEPELVRSALREISADYFEEQLLEGDETCVGHQRLLRSQSIKRVWNCSNFSSCYGGFGQSCKNFVAFDMLLSHERFINATYHYAMRIRPDGLYSLSDEAIESISLSLVKRTFGSHLFAVTDVFALMSRRIVGYFASHVLWDEHVTLCRTSHPDEWERVLDILMNNLELTARSSLVGLPTTTVALWGGQISGFRLEYAHTIRPWTSSLDSLLSLKADIARYVHVNTSQRYCARLGLDLATNMSCSAVCSKLGSYNYKE